MLSTVQSVEELFFDEELIAIVYFLNLNLAPELIPTAMMRLITACAVTKLKILDIDWELLETKLRSLSLKELIQLYRVIEQKVSARKL
jgi:hypothetical protein